MSLASEQPSEKDEAPQRFSKGGQAERIAYTYNDAVADTILRLDNIKREIDLLTKRLRLIHSQLTMLPEIAEHETKALTSDRSRVLVA